MSIIDSRNLTPLQFHEEAKWYNHQKAVAYGNILPLHAPLGIIPPFQFSKLDGWAIQSAHLVRQSDGTAIDVKAAMDLTGLNFFEPIASPAYAVWYFPGTVPLPVIGITEGFWYLRLQDSSGQYLLSEIFNFTNGLERRADFIKVSWWHNEDICLNGSSIHYGYPYRNYVWLQTWIGKPDYPIEEKVIKRGGVNFALETISYKVYKFDFPAAEYLLDSMRLIRLHDGVEVLHMGRIHEVDEFSLEVKWGDNGDVAIGDVEFRTDTVCIVSGRAYEDIDYEVSEGGCMVAGYEAEALILEGSPQYLGFYWTDEFGSDVGEFAVGQYALVKRTGDSTTDLFQRTGGGWVQIFPSNFVTAHTVRRSIPGELERRDSYFFRLSGDFLEAPTITNVSNVSDVYTISGATFAGTLVQIWIKDASGEWYLLQTGTSDDFNDSGTGLVFTLPADSSGFKVVAATYICPEIGESETETLTGIGAMEIEDTFIVAGIGMEPDPDDLEG